MHIIVFHLDYVRPSVGQTHRRDGGQFLAADPGRRCCWAFGPMRLASALGGAAFPLFFLSGAVGIGIGDVAFFQTLPRLGSRLTSLLIGCLSAPLAALIEWVWLGTTLSVAQILWGLLTVCGVGLALMPGEHVHRTRRDLFVGTLFSVLASAVRRGRRRPEPPGLRGRARHRRTPRWRECRLSTRASAGCCSAGFACWWSSGAPSRSRPTPRTSWSSRPR